MLRTIAAAEIRQQYRQGVLTVLGVLLIVLLGATLAARLASFQADQAESRAGARRVREQWVSQGSKHPHSGAHFGTAVFRQRLPLEVLEQGVVSFSGSIFPLVTHARDFPIDLPIESTTALTRYGELSPGVIGLAVLSLMIVFAGYGTVAADRQEGTLKLMLATGVAPASILLGKLVGLICAAGALWLLKCLIEAAVVAAATGSAPAAGLWLRFAGYQGVHLVYAAAWAIATIAVSAWVRQPRVALAVLLSCWIGNTVLLPRIASTAVRLLIPEPSAEQFAAAIKHDISYRADGTEWVNQWSEQLIADTLRRYGVKRIEDLPVGYAGIMLKSSDAHYEEVFEVHFDRLHQLHRRQQRWHHALSFLGPWVAARSLLQGFAGSDLAHLASFSDAAERYRRMLVESTNDAAEKRGKGSGWEVEVGRAYWESLPDFHFESPGPGWVLGQHWVSVGVLVFWLLLTSCGLYCARLRLERDV